MNTSIQSCPANPQNLPREKYLARFPRFLQEKGHFQCKILACKSSVQNSCKKRDIFSERFLQACKISARFLQEQCKNLALQILQVLQDIFPGLGALIGTE